MWRGQKEIISLSRLLLLDADYLFPCLANWPSRTCGTVFCLAEVEVTFKQLCFVFVATMAETTPDIRAVSPIPPTKASRPGACKRLGRETQLGHLAQSDQRDTPYHMMCKIKI